MYVIIYIYIYIYMYTHTYTYIHVYAHAVRRGNRALRESASLRVTGERLARLRPVGPILCHVV